jgi:hypothetical protein
VRERDAERDRGEAGAYCKLAMLSIDSGGAGGFWLEQPGGNWLGFWGGASAGGEGVYMGAFAWQRG